MGKQQTLNEIKSKMDRLGDLPVFSASVNHINKLSSDPDADAMSLSQEVLKDANLSIKLLRLANSPYYNRSLGKIGVVSRAIILLGFDTVKNLSLTMKFIESFQNEHPLINMDKLLVRAYITAGFVRDLAMQMGIKDAEETYTCALLHDLGEIAVAYFLPDKFIEIATLNKEGLLPPAENEKAILGATMATIGKELADSWEFSSKVISTMDHDLPKITGQITKPQELNKVLATLASKIVGSLYSSTPDKGETLHTMMADLSKATGIAHRKLESSLNDSFQMSCELAKTYGLPAKKLMPVVAETGDEARDKVARQFSFLVSSQGGKQAAVEENNSGASAAAPAQSSGANHSVAPNAATAGVKPAADSDLDPELQLQFIQEITSLITDSAKLTTVLVKVLEGIHTAVGFSRVVLCLLGADRKSYVGRIAIGTDKEALKEYFNHPLTPDNDIFSRVVLENADIIVEDTHDKRWEAVLSNKYHTHVGAHSFVVACLRSNMKPLGFIYADKGTSKHPITPQQHRGFTQFVAQARLALQTCR
jgi:HD-like signal output (HDOD) protein